MEDFWSQIPIEIACEIISRLTDLRTIARYEQTSRLFNRYAQICIVRVDWPVKIRLPLTYFLKFKNLQVIGDNIIVTARPEELPLLSSLPFLSTINLHVTSNQSRSLILAAVSGLQMNLRLALEIGLFTIIREKEFTFYPQNARIQTQYIDPFLTTHSQLRLITLPQDLFPLNRLIQEFFRNTDFGLVDPSRPPSDDNLPLSLFVQRLVESGTISRAEFYRLFRIYTIYHQHQDGPLILDEKTGPVIEPGILTINRERIRRSQSTGSLYPEVLLPVDAIELNLLFGYAPAFLNPNLETFTEYDLPRPLSEEEFRSISDLIYSAHRFYMITNSLRFYRTDGCFFEFN